MSVVAASVKKKIGVLQVTGTQDDLVDPKQHTEPFTRAFFFFQAEDGIRDGTVTGVQTCALPILVGSRGAMTGIGVSIGIAMAYWGVGKLFEQIGNANQLPPGLAAWSPDVIFALAGTYLLLRMRS